jgi:hypothetical protein
MRCPEATLVLRQLRGAAGSPSGAGCGPLRGFFDRMFSLFAGDEGRTLRVFGRSGRSRIGDDAGGGTRSDESDLGRGVEVHRGSTCRRGAGRLVGASGSAPLCAAKRGAPGGSALCMGRTRCGPARRSRTGDPRGVDERGEPNATSHGHTTRHAGLAHSSRRAEHPPSAGSEDTIGRVRDGRRSLLARDRSHRAPRLKRFDRARGCGSRSGPNIGAFVRREGRPKAFLPPGVQFQRSHSSR